jgi:ABC-type molybdate transport system substrate-binding protein
MSNASPTYRTRGYPAAKAIAVSAALVAVLGFLLAWLVRDAGRGETRLLEVYCAAGIRPPIEDLARRYRSAYGVEVRLQYGNSGGLISSIEAMPRGDLYIPADAVYVDRGRAKGLLAESIPLARFRLVIATKPGNPKRIATLDATLDDVLAPGVRYVVCNTQAGVGELTKRALEASGRWDAVAAGDCLYKPTVVDAANAVATSTAVDAAFIWDSTARQHDLDVVDIAELAGEVATIHVSVLRASERPPAALHFARYLASPEHGEPVFTRHRYEFVRGDPWEEVPRIAVFAGGANRGALEATLDEFARREGCRLDRVFAGCGTLVGQIQSSPIKPGLFVTCDASYLDKVQDFFVEGTDLSETRIGILARKDRGAVRAPADLAREGVSVGITDPRASALGVLTVDLLEALGLWERIERNVKVHAPTAHELVLQLEAHDKLDAVLVFEANAQHVSKDLEFVPIDHPRARAVQNMAASRDTRHPQLVGRLEEAILSSASRERFLASGFSWRAGSGARHP